MALIQCFLSSDTLCRDMAIVTCQRCDREIEESDARWYRPYAWAESSDHQTDQLISTVSIKPDPMGLLYCQECMAAVTDNSDQAND